MTVNATSRLQLIADRVTSALTPVMRELRITEDELHAAGDFLDRVGQAGMCKSLLDIAFAMTAIDTRRHGIPGTRTNLEGPVYRPGAPTRATNNLIERDLSPDADLLVLSGQVTDAVTGRPMSGVELDFWHADEHGRYDYDGNHLRGVVHSGQDGRYRVDTIMPVDYAEHLNDPIGELLAMLDRDGYRAAHIHLKVRVRGVERLTTQLFRGDSPHLDQDYVIGAVSEDLVVEPRLVGTVDGHRQYAMSFDIAVPPLPADHLVEGS
ncbi:intradiol ring-cleavage dioxygenase [Amycolatopsis acidiphila]